MTHDNLFKKLLSSAVYNYIGKSGTVIFSTLTTIYVVRKLSIGDFGIYNILLNLVATAFFFYWHRDPRNA